MMFEELTEIGKPGRILFREKEIGIIKKNLEEIKNNEEGENLILYGPSGTGKTSVVEFVLADEESHHVFISGRSSNTSIKILKGIFDLSYGTKERLLGEGIKKLKQNRKIIFIDEIDKIGDVEMLFDDLNTIYRETLCPLVIISNNRNLMNRMKQDAFSTLHFKRIEFLPYDPVQMQKILLDRMNIMKDKYSDFPQIPEDFVPYLCAFMKREGHDSIRDLFFTAKNCLKENNFSREFIIQVLKLLNEQDWGEWFGTLSSSKKRVIIIIISLVNKGVTEISSSDILPHMNGLSPQSVSRLLNELENEGIIKSYWVNHGFKNSDGFGKRYVKFTIPDYKKKIEQIVEDKLILL